MIAGFTIFIDLCRSSPIYPLLTEAGIRVVYAIPGILLATILPSLYFQEIIHFGGSRTDEEEERP